MYPPHSISAELARQHRDELLREASDRRLARGEREPRAGERPSLLGLVHLLSLHAPVHGKRALRPR